MNRFARNWRVLLGGVAAGSVAVFGFAGATASAEPDLPLPPAPAPATVTQTVTVTPGAPAPATEATPAPAGPAPAEPVAAPATPALPPATSGTMAEFFKDNSVVMEPQTAADFTALNIVLPVPAGWSVVPDPNVPDAFSVIADRQGGDGLYTSNAQLIVTKLVGEFDPREAISHGYVESQKLPAWQSTAASMAEFGGFPSSVIEGTYRANDLTLNSSRRNLIAQSGSDRYLVSLSVTTAANQAVAASAATDGIVNGFRVTVPGATPATPAPASATPAAPPAAAAAALAAAPPAPGAAAPPAVALPAVALPAAAVPAAEPAG